MFFVYSFASFYFKVAFYFFQFQFVLFSDLQSREVSCPEIDRKRQASPLSICSSRKKHCIVNQSNLQCENSGTHEKNLKEIQSGVVDKTMVTLELS